MNRASLALSAILLAIVPIASRADSPLPPPVVSKVCVNSGEFCATSDPMKNSVCVEHVESTSAPWCTPQWERIYFLAEDAEAIAAAHPGMNLIPLDSTEATPMLRFYSRAGLVRIVTLGELLPDLTGLERTISHWNWGTVAGIDSEGHVMVLLADGRRLSFSVHTGARVSDERSQHLVTEPAPRR